MRLNCLIDAFQLQLSKSNNFHLNCLIKAPVILRYGYGHW